MGLGSNGAVALRRERLQASDACFSADIAKLTTYRSAFSGRRKYLRLCFCGLPFDFSNRAR